MAVFFQQYGYEQYHHPLWPFGPLPSSVSPAPSSLCVHLSSSGHSRRSARGDTEKKQSSGSYSAQASRDHQRTPPRSCLKTQSQKEREIGGGGGGGKEEKVRGHANGHRVRAGGQWGLPDFGVLAARERQREMTVTDHKLDRSRFALGKRQQQRGREGERGRERRGRGTADRGGSTGRW
eukprot:3769048-Rhodomonas_salina.1